MSNSDNEEDATIDIQNKGLTELPVNEPDWSRATGIFLQDNEITELNADILPRTLMFLDLTGNPIVRVTGTFPDSLSSLVLTRTKIEKLGLLPEALTELVINDTPMARKYGIYSDVRDKAKMKRLSDIPFEEGSIMVDNTPEGREINSNSNSEISFSNNNSVNQNYIDGGSRAAYNSDDTRYLVMILEKIEDEKDIKYRVQTLNDGEKLVFKQYLEPYEPNNSNLIEPLALTNPPAVYTKEGHAEDILFEHPVPPGCVYVTIEECSVLSSNWGKLLFAFEDKPAGIREKLRDPVKYKRDLLAHFGRAFHVHYPEAEKYGDRTYVDCIHYPFLAWNKEKCKIGKSGVLSLDDNNIFVNEAIDSTRPYDEEQILKIVDCNNIKDEDLHKLLDGSKFPTYKMVKDDLFHSGDDTLKYGYLRKVMNKYAFTQSWSFKMFPGVHYNFSCRDIAKHSPENDRIRRRRAQSLEGPSNNINAMTDEEIKGDIGFTIFSGYVKAGVTSMFSKMIEKGVDVNKKDENGKTLLQWASGKFKIPLVKELLKVPGIDKTGAVEAVEESVGKLITFEARSEQQKAIYRENADELIALINDTPVKGGKRKKTRGRSRRVRKTRRVKRFK
jgi:hypothetical protein